MSIRAQRGAWVVTVVGLLVGLVILDGFRVGPASTLSRCNLALSRSTEQAADVLVVGSSRTGTAIDPVALQDMLGAEPGFPTTTVERIALGRSPLRATVGLLENYLERPGREKPKVIVLEVSFLTERTIERIEGLGSGLSADAFLFRRDINLLRYEQLLKTPAVAMPYTETEGRLNRLRLGLRGTTLRSGSLMYQFAREPLVDLSLKSCSAEAFTREPDWPDDFAFSWDSAVETGRPSARIETLRAAASEEGSDRPLQDWQIGLTTDRVYPYDVGEAYRAGELLLLDRAVDLASSHGIPVVLLPLPVYGTRPSGQDLALLDGRFDGDAEVYDLYADADVDLTTYWHDDAHLELTTAGELTTALLGQHLIDGAFLSPGPDRRPGGSSRDLTAPASE